MLLQDRAEVIQRAKAAGVASIVVTGCTVPSAKAARELCESVQVCPAGFIPQTAHQLATHLHSSWVTPGARAPQ